ncbi:MAG: AI-2E family transporter [Candidatus Aenigmarchaeota archaeon]|nr:AI-2E family transporter [Candidatus Aenigmarchaeota archaeon]
MMNEDRFVLILLGILAILTFLIIQPFITYILFSVVLTVVVYPVYKKIESKINYKIISALLTVILVLLLIVIPLTYLTVVFIGQARDVISGVGNLDLHWLDARLQSLGIDLKVTQNLNTWIFGLTELVKANIVNNAVIYTTTVFNFFTGMAVVFFVMFYLLIDGKMIMKEINNHIPLKEKYKSYLNDRIYKSIQGLFIGLLLTSLGQGVVAGIGFYLFGISNPVFWGFITMLVSLLPFIGSPIVYIPLSIFSAVEGNLFQGIGLLAYGIFVISNSDNLIRAYVVKINSNMHSLSVILGAIGGVSLLGFSGIVIGPLVLELFSDLLRVYNMMGKKR